jgi:hypothetical protein
MSGTAEGAPETPGGRSPLSRVLPWVQTILLNIVAPAVTYGMLTDTGIGEVPALLLSGIWPALELLLTLVVSRRIDEFSVLVLIFLLVGTVAPLLFDDPNLLLIKDPAVSGLFGVALLASLLAPRPLMFYFGRRFATDGTTSGAAWWNGLWQYPGFRRSQRILTVVWGASLLVEALLQIELTFQLPFGAVVVVDNTLPYLVLALLVGGTMLYGKRAGARARAEA